MKPRDTQPRYVVCKECSREWNISKNQKIPLGGYLCPNCREKYRRIMRSR